jgi:hypothetical protein
VIGFSSVLEKKKELEEERRKLSENVFHLCSESLKDKFNEIIVNDNYE